MNLDTVPDTMLAEVARLATLQLWKYGGKAGARLRQLLSRKHLDSVDIAELERQLRAAAAADPDWAAEIADALAEVSSDRTTPRCNPLLAPFRDRVDAIGSISDSGVCVIAGRKGIGRGTLAHRYAEVRREHFLGGSVDLDLDDFRGASGELVVRDAQRRFLADCGVEAKEQEDSAADVHAQFRREFTHRRMVLIVRNVRNAAELEPFEPTTPRNLVIATTADLGADFRQRYHRSSLLQLDGLDHEGACELLADRCGRELIEAEPDSTKELLALCDHRPDALAYAGARLSGSYGSQPVAALVARLRERGVADALGLMSDSVDEFVAGLSARDATDVRLLATHPGNDFDLGSAAALLGHDADDAIGKLDAAGMLTTVSTRSRWRLHHDVRDHLRAGLGDEPADAAFARVLGYFRDCAFTADHNEDEDRLRVYPTGVGERLTGGTPAELLRYLHARRHVLFDLVREATDRGYDAEVCQLGGALEVLVTKHGGQEWFIGLGEFVLTAAERLGRSPMLARAHAMQGRMHFLVGLLDRARSHLERASELVASLPAEWWQLRSSLYEFWGRWYELRGDLTTAEAQLTEAVRIDRENGDGRALLIHTRMLANVVSAAGHPERAWPLLNEAAEIPDARGRNLARVYMVGAWAALRVGNPADATRWADQAQATLAADGATAYEWELGELRAEIATMTGPVEYAAGLWAGLADAAMRVNSRRTSVYFQRLQAFPR